MQVLELVFAFELFHRVPWQVNVVALRQFHGQFRFQRPLDMQVQLRFRQSSQSLPLCRSDHISLHSTSANRN